MHGRVFKTSKIVLLATFGGKTGEIVLFAPIKFFFSLAYKKKFVNGRG